MVSNLGFNQGLNPNLLIRTKPVTKTYFRKKYELISQTSAADIKLK